MNDYENNLNQTWSEDDPFTLNRYLQFSKFIKDGNYVLDIGCNTVRGGGVLKNIFPNLKLYGIDLKRIFFLRLKCILIYIF